MQTTTARAYPEVSADGVGVVSHAGAALLSEMADRVGLTAAFGEATDRLRVRRSGHDPGRVLVDVAVAIADGAETITDVQALADQPLVHGQVASTATIWRVLDGVDDGTLAGLRSARAQARRRAWAARGELTGSELPPARAAGRELDYVVIDVDATLVTAHSDKEGAAGNFKGGFGFHVLLAYLDNTGEALAGMLRPGNAGSNTAADRITVLDQAFAATRAASGRSGFWSGSKARRLLPRLIDYLRASGLEYSVGFPSNASVLAAVEVIPAWVWSSTLQAYGLLDGAELAEFTDLINLSGWPRSFSRD